MAGFGFGCFGEFLEEIEDVLGICGCNRESRITTIIMFYRNSGMHSKIIEVTIF